MDREKASSNKLRPRAEAVLLTTAEAAPLLRVSTATFLRWCREGKVPAFKIGHEWRVRVADLQRIVGERGPMEAGRDDSQESVHAAPGVTLGNGGETQEPIKQRPLPIRGQADTETSTKEE